MEQYDNGGFIGGPVVVMNTSGDPIRVHPYQCDCRVCLADA